MTMMRRPPPTVAAAEAKNKSSFATESEEEGEYNVEDISCKLWLFVTFKESHLRSSLGLFQMTSASHACNNNNKKNKMYFPIRWS